MKSLWNGIVPQLSQGVLGSAIMMMIKERLGLVVRALLFAMFASKSIAA